ncbi:MAG: acetyl-CoA carboxylase biotin carboxyl carrier protein [Phycisphaerales bacterium]
MIDIRKLNELVRLMVDHDLSELDLKDQSETVTIKRGAQGVPIVAHHPAPPIAAPPAHAPGNNGPAPAAADAGMAAIASPMVGTLYLSPNPDSKPFIAVGAAVSPDTVVCLIEAMKVFNEIKAERAGVIDRVLVANGSAVEFGQKIFLVRPA